MVLPIISSLASVSSSISLISTGLTGISSIIGGLGGLLSGAFSAGLVAFDTFKTNVESFFTDLEGTLEDVFNFDEVMSEADSFFSSLEDKGKKAFGSIGSFLGLSSSASPAVDPLGGGSGERKPASAYIPGYVAPTPTATFDSPRKSFAEMETRHPLAGLNDTLEGLRYLIENEGGLVQAINRKAGETNVTVNVHGGAMERRAAMAVGNIIREEANRKTGTQQRATRYL
jgi:hypothetical protein